MCTSHSYHAGPLVQLLSPSQLEPVTRNRNLSQTRRSHKEIEMQIKTNGRYAPHSLR